MAHRAERYRKDMVFADLPPYALCPLLIDAAGDITAINLEEKHGT
jgi:hypothetical protein